MRCKICDFADKPTAKFKKVKMIKDEPLCLTCRGIIKLTIPGVSSNITFVGQLDKAVQELEYRIPELFNGIECPGDCSCDCTKDCKLLAVRNKVLDKV